MRNHLTAWILSSVVALAGGTLMAQSGGAGSTMNPNNTTGTTSGNSGTPSAIGSASPSAQIQIEGQLVDVLSASLNPGPGASSSVNAGGSSSSAGSSSNMTGAGSSSSARPGSSSSNTTAVPPANLNGGNTLGEGASRSSIAVGPGRTGTTGNVSGGNTLGSAGSMTGTGTTGNVSGGNTLGSSVSTSNMTGAGSTGSLGSSSLNTGSNSSMTASNSSLSSTDGTASSEIRRQLNSGIPAAVVSGGQTYILAVDARTLATHAGETVRISGRTASNNILIPDRIEARQGTTGEFREVAFTKPNAGNRTAGER